MEVRNRKAYFDYQVVASFEAGIVLTGAETKSIKNGGVNLTGARVVTDKDSLKLVGANVMKYQFDGGENHEALRSKKLLMKKQEIVGLDTKMRSEGLTAVPLRMYNKGSLIKVEIGLVRGKKKFEKRALLKKRTEERGLAKKLKKVNGN